MNNAKELRELNAWIAEHVMGWRLTNYTDGRSAETPDDYADAATNDGWTWNNGTDEEAWQFQPTSKSAYAMDVLEKCCEKLPSFDVCIWKGATRALWYCGIRRKTYDMTTFAKAPTLNLAICLFAKQLFSK